MRESLHAQKRIMQITRDTDEVKGSLKIIRITRSIGGSNTNLVEAEHGVRSSWYQLETCEVAGGERNSAIIADGINESKINK